MASIHSLAWCVLIMFAQTVFGRGAATPWTTIEAEDMTRGGQANILGPSYVPYTSAAEASNRKCVALNNTGDYVEFTVQNPTNSLVVRYSLPDSAQGTGITGTLSLYINGGSKTKLTMTSTLCYLYGGYPFTNDPNAGSPRNRYDELRVFPFNVNVGDKVRLQRDSEDNAPYYIIDFVDTEQVGAAKGQPSGYLNAVTDCGVPTDGVTPAQSQLQNCIFKSMPVYVPAGNYLITGDVYLIANSILQGAGMWYTNFVGDPSTYNSAGNRVRIYGQSNATAADFAVIGKLNYRGDSEPNDGVTGDWGQNSKITRVWIEHTKTGLWLTNSLNLVVDSCRVRNTIADGVNLCSGMSGTTVVNNAHRNTGDDSFAMWPMGGGQWTHGNNVFMNCTGQFPFLAQGGSIYGGVSNSIQNCYFVDYTYGCGVLISSTFAVAVPFGGTTTVDSVDLERAGGYDQGTWRSALQLYPDTMDISGVKISNMNILDSASNGISVISQSGHSLTNAQMTNVNENAVGLGNTPAYGLYVNSNAKGQLDISSSKLVSVQNDSPSFVFNQS